MSKNQNEILNKIIPADDLFWDDEENKYIALSSDEIDTILRTCLENNINQEKDVIDILNWYTTVRVGELLMKNFIAGRLSIVGLDETGEPIFSQKEDKPSDYS